MKDNTCILLFSRTAAGESRHKQLVGKRGTNVIIHDALYKRALATASKSGLPIIKIDEHNQVGNTFGEKFTNALLHAYNSGYEHVIAVGGDCPKLGVKDILYAQEELHAGRQVLGPSNDGGVYLLGISSAFFKIQMAEFAWQTENLYTQLCTYLIGMQACIVHLAKKLDVDTAAQFNSLADYLSSQIGFEFLLDTAVKIGLPREIFSHLEYAFLSGSSRRGPPAFKIAA